MEIIMLITIAIMFLIFMFKVFGTYKVRKVSTFVFNVFFALLTIEALVYVVLANINHQDPNAI